jgi:hypothetical protein
MANNSTTLRLVLIIMATLAVTSLLLAIFVDDMYVVLAILFGALTPLISGMASNDSKKLKSQ